MRMGYIQKTEWKRLDDTLRPLIKKTLYLPKSATSGYIYGSPQTGACGVPHAAELSDICRIDTAYKLLTSPDQTVADLASAALMTSAVKRSRNEDFAPELAAYLSGEGGVFEGPSRGIKNIWTEARKASKRNSITWEFRPEGPELTTGDTTINAMQRNKVVSTLRRKLTATRDDHLQSLPNQGKVLECVALDRSSTHFMRTGMFTRFADWRFIHRARLNLLRLNAARPWEQGYKRCRRCGAELETLPHVANHCMRYSALYTARHNKIVRWIRQAAEARYTVFSENQAIGDTGLRPDLVVARGEEAIVYDATVVFDNRQEAFRNARAEKEQKYSVVRITCDKGFSG
ncbi:uncharacterized protein LOC135372841 [Ornithodoros turicata]|uniref:uncharacterized protein LOC135372841 n=1 Tax=Ornithodoros turicata TaxID=34597 RepID=UPI003139440F